MSKRERPRPQIAMGARARLLCAAGLVAVLAGCSSGRTYYQPALTARGELTLRYDDEFQLWASGQPVAFGHHYSGLPAFVRCVPKAYDHALDARSSGAAGTTLSTLGIVFSVAGLGGLSGLGYYNSDPKLMGALLGAGVGAGVLGVVLAGISRTYKNDANGHAVDAMNYYNDAVGSLGASCNDLVYPAPAGAAPPSAPPPASTDDGDDDDDDEAPPAPKHEPDSQPGPAPTSPRQTFDPTPIQ